MFLNRYFLEDTYVEFLDTSVFKIYATLFFNYMYMLSIILIIN